MKRFDAKDYYTIYEPESGSGSTLYKPTNLGLDLIGQYLQNKYQTSISHPIKIKLGDSEAEYYSESDMELTINNEIKKIKAANEGKENYRHAFIWGDGSTHAVFVAYIKEGSEERIFYSDSLGSSLLKSEEKINAYTGIKVLTTREGRQADDQSCYTDALIFARDVTAINPVTGTYLIPNLIGKLEEREELHPQNKAISYVKHPDELIKTTQTTAFKTKHQDKSSEAQHIHKSETLDEFLARYRSNEPRSTATYLAQKGLKNTRIMEIQFYINEMEATLGPISKELKQEFIKKAKEFFKTNNQGSLYDLAVSFQNQLIEEHGYEEISSNLAANVNKTILDIETLPGFSAALKASENKSEFVTANLHTFLDIIETYKPRFSVDTLMILKDIPADFYPKVLPCMEKMLSSNGILGLMIQFEFSPDQIKTMLENKSLKDDTIELVIKVTQNNNAVQQLQKFSEYLPIILYTEEARSRIKQAAGTDQAKLDFLSPYVGAGNAKPDPSKVEYPSQQELKVSLSHARNANQGSPGNPEEIIEAIKSRIEDEEFKVARFLFKGGKETRLSNEVKKHLPHGVAKIYNLIKVYEQNGKTDAKSVLQEIQTRANSALGKHRPGRRPATTQFYIEIVMNLIKPSDRAHPKL